jgi:hypothetical protein
MRRTGSNDASASISRHFSTEVRLILNHTLPMLRTLNSNLGSIPGLVPGGNLESLTPAGESDYPRQGSVILQ